MTEQLISPAQELRADASISAAALHLLLAQHAELVELEMEWRIDGADAVIRPNLSVDHPDTFQATELLARALELPLQSSAYTSGADGHRRLCITVQGRWGGAQWRSINYCADPAPKGQPIARPSLRAVTS
jgi:hypothetical protein